MKINGLIFSLIAMVLVLVSGCAVGPKVQNSFAERTIVVIPGIGLESDAEIGQTIISKAFLATSEAIRIQTPASEVVNFPGTTTIPAGIHPIIGKTEDGKLYSARNGTYTLMGASVPTVGSAIFVPNNKNMPAVVYHHTAMGYVLGKQPIAGIEYTTAEKWSDGSFKKELVYSGISQNTITILYREYQENIARPAFSQELRYDLSQGKTIGYKGARFEVLKATNTDIKYKVIKSID